jgi:hypothetical protein
MSASPKVPALDLDGTLGDIQIALVLATWLFGIGTLQTFNYYREFPKDPKILKGLVRFFAQDSHTISNACAGRKYLVRPSFLRSYRFLIYIFFLRVFLQNRFLELGHTIVCWHAVSGDTVIGSISNFSCV